MSTDPVQPDSILIDGSTPHLPSELITLLNSLSIDHSILVHPPLHTVEESKIHRPDNPGGFTKNLFVYNKKKQMWLLTLQEDRVINLKQAAKQLSAQNFSFASPERLMQYLGIRPGSVSPLALINDKSNQVQFVIDEALLAHEMIHVHPLDNCQTLTMPTQKLLNFLASTNHDYLTI
ncbi:MAG: Ala-tRNA(Pro) deacylase [Saprospiraceae bacterium]|jgi:Ala-tRNA(Pro) deacylase